MFANTKINNFSASKATQTQTSSDRQKCRQIDLNKWQIKRADPEMYPFDTSCLSQSFYFCCIIMRIAEAVAQLITRLLSLQ